MPTYLYRTPEGRLHEWQCRMSYIPQQLLVNGQVAERDLVAEHTGQKSGDAWTEHTSLALSVHPDDIEKYTKDAKSKGVIVDFNEAGYPQFRSRSDQRKYCQAYGYTNYGDTW